MSEQSIYSFKVWRDGLRGSGRVKAANHRDASQQIVNMYGRVGLNANINLLKNQKLAMKQWDEKNAKLESVSN